MGSRGSHCYLGGFLHFVFDLEKWCLYSHCDSGIYQRRINCTQIQVTWGQAARQHKAVLRIGKWSDSSTGYHYSLKWASGAGGFWKGYCKKGFFFLAFFFCFLFGITIYSNHKVNSPPKIWGPGHYAVGLFLEFIAARHIINFPEMVYIIPHYLKYLS